MHGALELPGARFEGSAMGPQPLAYRILPRSGERRTYFVEWNIERTQAGDDARRQHLLGSVIAVTGARVYPDWSQQAEVVVVAKGAYGQATRARETPDSHPGHAG